MIDISLTDRVYDILKAECTRIEHPCVAGTESGIGTTGAILTVMFNADVDRTGFDVVALERRVSEALAAQTGRMAFMHCYPAFVGTLRPCARPYITIVWPRETLKARGW